MPEIQFNPSVKAPNPRLIGLAALALFALFFLGYFHALARPLGLARALGGALLLAYGYYHGSGD